MRIGVRELSVSRARRTAVFSPIRGRSVSRGGSGLLRPMLRPGRGMEDDLRLS